MVTKSPDYAYSGKYDSASPPASFLSDCNFKFGSLRASLSTDDVEFRERFSHNYLDCLETTENPAGNLPVTLKVRSSFPGDAVIAEISELDGFSTCSLFARLFPELDLVPADINGRNGWQCYISKHANYPNSVLKLALNEPNLKLQSLRKLAGGLAESYFPE